MLRLSVAIFDFSPQVMRYRLYLAGSGGEALFEQDHVRQQLADALETNPNALVVSPVRDIPLKHGNVMCVEFDWSSASYERVLELSTQGFVRIAHPSKPHLNGTKVAVAQSVDDLQQLLGFSILRAIGSTAADGGAEVGAAPLRIDCAADLAPHRRVCFRGCWPAVATFHPTPCYSAGCGAIGDTPACAGRGYDGRVSAAAGISACSLADRR